MGGIPSFAVVDANGKTLNANARGKVAAGVDAILKDGWAPPAVGDMAEGPDAQGTDINETPTVVAFCAKASVESQASIEAAMTEVAKKYIAEKGDDDIKYIFLMVKGESQ